MYLHNIGGLIAKKTISSRQPLVIGKGIEKWLCSEYIGIYILFEAKEWACLIDRGRVFQSLTVVTED